MIRFTPVIIGTCALILMMNTACSKNAIEKTEPISIIFDTDMGPDYDDVGALAVLHAMADSGYVEILATVSSNKMEQSTQLIDIINTYYNRPDIAIGVTKDENGKNNNTWHKGKKWTEELPKKYKFDQPMASESMDAVKVYRTILAKQPDKSLTIITVGFLTNLKNLLLSEPDEISNLSGEELVSAKVKFLVSMACKFPSGREYNAYADVLSTKFVIESWPSEIIFSGAEIGRYIRTGDKLVEEGVDSPIKEAYLLSMSQDMLEFDNSRYEMGGRASYDQTAVLAAIKPNEYFDTEKGNVFIEDDGSNTWEVTSTGKHMILKHKYPYQSIANIIEKLMMCKPQKEINNDR